MNKLIAFLLLSASLCFAFTSGDGTYENPYEIAGQSDIVNLIDMVATNTCSGLYFLQTDDIDLTPFGNFQGIGSPSAPFSGFYDGDGYYVSNLTITASVSGATTNAFGFFGYVQNPTIENINVQGKVSVVADYNSSACVGVGGCIGLSIKGTFAAIKNFVDIDFKLTNGSSSHANNSNIRYGVGGCVGLFGWLPKGANYTNFNIYYLENYGNIYADGLDGYCCVGGCCSANNPNTDAQTSLVGFGNYGKIVCSALNATDTSRNVCVGGVASVHWFLGSGGTSGSPVCTSCFNYGDILGSNSVHIAGIFSVGKSGGNHLSIANYCTNYADLVSVSDTATGRIYIGGVAASAANFRDMATRHCVNFGKLKAYGDGVGVPQIGGVLSELGSEAVTDQSYYNKNFGDIEAIKPNANSIVVGGVYSSDRKAYQASSENYGNINVQTKGSVLVGGVATTSGDAYVTSILRNCVNFGNITASGNVSTNYSPCVGGVLAATRIVGARTRNIVVSNCYNLGTMKLNLNSDECFGAIYGVANTYGNYGVSIKNCYAILGEGQNLIGAVDASNGNVSLENCVGIKSGVNGGIAYSVSGSNNWSQANTTIVAYEDCYTNPYQCYGNMGSGIFTPAEKSTNYYDLILPINTILYSTPSATDKKNHNYTKARGYKRYVKTNRK